MGLLRSSHELLSEPSESSGSSGKDTQGDDLVLVDLSRDRSEKPAPPLFMTPTNIFGHRMAR